MFKKSLTSLFLGCLLLHGQGIFAQPDSLQWPIVSYDSLMEKEAFVEAIALTQSLESLATSAMDSARLLAMRARAEVKQSHYAEALALQLQVDSLLRGALPVVLWYARMKDEMAVSYYKVRKYDDAFQALALADSLHSPKDRDEPNRKISMLVLESSLYLSKREFWLRKQ
jgi:hypothetical protein